MPKSKTVKANTWFAGLSLFLLLMAIYLLRPLRDEAAVNIGVNQLGWLITATFTLFCLLSIWTKVKASEAIRSFQRISLLIAFGVSICVCFEIQVALFLLIGTGSLLLVSLFWGVLNNSFDKTVAISQYPKILLIGSLGGLSGPLLVTFLAPNGSRLIGILAAFILVASAFMLRRVKPFQSDNKTDFHQSPQQNRPWPLATIILLYSLLGTVLYGEHLAIVEIAGLSPDDQLRFFGQRDLYVGMVTFVLQFLRQRFKSNTSWLGFKLMPLFTLIIMLTIGLFTSLETVLWSMVLFRSFSYSYLRPAREVYHLSKFNHFKIFIDTVIYRAGDLIGIWLFQLLMYHQFDYLQVGLFMIPMVIVWMLINQKIVKSLNV